MPHVTLMRFAGDPDDLLARKERHIDPVTSRHAAAYGGLAHVTARTDDGILVINVMDNDAAVDRIGADPELVEAMRESGLPQPSRERLEVTRLVLHPPQTA